jgi:hypothetical protein
VFIRGFDVSRLFRIDVSLRRRAPLSRANGLAYVELQQHRHRAACFGGLHTRIRHEWMIILRSSEEFWRAGTDDTNYGVPLVLECRGYAKEPSQYRNNLAHAAAVGIHAPDYNQSLSSFPDAART